jgi:hypothetical protein
MELPNLLQIMIQTRVGSSTGAPKCESYNLFTKFDGFSRLIGKLDFVNLTCLVVIREQ